MTDEQFVIRVAHIITSSVLEPVEQLILIKLTYLKMAFPEKTLPDTYTVLTAKLYGDKYVDVFLNEKMDDLEKEILEDAHNTPPMFSEDDDGD
jgi:hypothetical protein